jgi:hypothetical protein
VGVEGEIVGRRFFDLAVRVFKRKLGKTETYKALALFSPAGFTLSLDDLFLSSSDAVLIYLRRFRPTIRLMVEDEERSSYQLGGAGCCLSVLGKRCSIEEIENKVYSCTKSACLDSMSMHSFNAVLFIVGGKPNESYLTLDHQEGATLL